MNGLDAIIHKYIWIAFVNGRSIAANIVSIRNLTTLYLNIAMTMKSEQVR
jgi:hypothetical protein